MAKPNPPEVAELSALLSAKPSEDGLAQLISAVTALGEGGLAVLRRAAKGSKRRAERRQDVLLALGPK